MQEIITAQAGALQLALQEVGDAHIVRRLEKGVALCVGVSRPEDPIFLRHMCPATMEISLTGGMEDIQDLLGAFRLMLPVLKPEKGTFSIQTRIMEGYHPEYKRFDVNTALSEIVLAKGVTLDVKNPAQVVSVTLAKGNGWIGISKVGENISAYAGGVRRYKQEEGQISRAEFKLLEAMETFGIAPQDGQHAIDLGAAPGGWTRILRRRGLYVTAVDPAALDDRLKKDKRVTHYVGTAQAYFRAAHDPCDMMVNDMKMDSAESAALMVEGIGCLKPGGTGILTLKLPEDVSEWRPRVDQAREILQAAYTVRGMRQLFHNRNEVTVWLERPAE